MLSTWRDLLSSSYGVGLWCSISWFDCSSVALTRHHWSSSSSAVGFIISLGFSSLIWVTIPSSPFSRSSSSSWCRRYAATSSLGLFNLKWKRAARLWSTVHKFRRLSRRYFKLLIDRCDWRDFALITTATMRLSTSALIRVVHPVLCLCSPGRISGFNSCPLSIGLIRKNWSEIRRSWVLGARRSQRCWTQREDCWDEC